MSTLTADPKFRRGSTLGITLVLYEAVNGDGSTVIGTRSVFRDEHAQTGVLQSNRTVECIAVKNTSGAALLPGQIAKFDTADILGSVNGLAATTDTLIGVVDEYLPTSGVPAGEVFWLVVKGPTTVNKTTGAGTGISAAAAVTVSATAGSAAAGSSPLLGYAITTTGTTDATQRVLLRTTSGL